MAAQNGRIRKNSYRVCSGVQSDCRVVQLVSGQIPQDDEPLAMKTPRWFFGALIVLSLVFGWNAYGAYDGIQQIKRMASVPFLVTQLAKPCVVE